MQSCANLEGPIKTRATYFFKVGACTKRFGVNAKPGLEQVTSVHPADKGHAIWTTNGIEETAQGLHLRGRVGYPSRHKFRQGLARCLLFGLVCNDMGFCYWSQSEEVYFCQQRGTSTRCQARNCVPHGEVTKEPDCKEIAPIIRKLSAGASNLSASPVRIQVCIGKTIDVFSLSLLFPDSRACRRKYLSSAGGRQRSSAFVHGSAQEISHDESKRCNARNQTSGPWVDPFSQRIQSVNYTNSRGPHAWSSAWQSTVVLESPVWQQWDSVWTRLQESLGVCVVWNGFRV